MATSRHEGNLTITGHLSCASFAPPDNSIDDDAIRADANIGAEKQEHQYVKTLPLSAHATTPSVTRQVIHVVQGLTGTVLEFSLGATVAPTGGDSVVATLLKNGTTILSASITLDSGNTNFVPEDGTISSGSVVADDVLEVSVTAVTGTTCKGLFARMKIRETAD